MIDRHLHESFAGQSVDPRLKWYCEPSRWSVPTDGRLVIEPDGGTDFWRKTHYEFEADNGHFLFMDVAGDFVLTTHVLFRPANQYDQAGLMVRVSPTCWLKASVEYEPDGPSRLGAVVTNFGYSDWSTQGFPASRDEVWLRVRREDDTYVVDASSDGLGWEQVRMAHLHDEREDTTVACGLYACSPKGVGFVAEFAFLTIDKGGLS